jgi:transcriptional regulator with XRE-family HTH domain
LTILVNVAIVWQTKFDHARLWSKKMITIGERLKEERNRLGLSQAGIGDIAGITKNSQINYEANKRSPDSAYLAKIAEIGADVNYILTGVRVVTGSINATLDDCTGSMVGTYTPPTGEGTMLKGGGANDERFSEEDLQILRMIKRLPPTQKKHEITNISVVLQSIDEAISHYIATNGIEHRQAA